MAAALSQRRNNPDMIARRVRLQLGDIAGNESERRDRVFEWRRRSFSDRDQFSDDAMSGFTNSE